MAITAGSLSFTSAPLCIFIRPLHWLLYSTQRARGVSTCNGDVHTRQARRPRRAMPVLDCGRRASPICLVAPLRCDSSSHEVFDWRGSNGVQNQEAATGAQTRPGENHGRGGDFHAHLVTSAGTVRVEANLLANPTTTCNVVRCLCGVHSLPFRVLDPLLSHTLFPPLSGLSLT
jgi:hypothetical protein